tara:strand:- start:970 stop:1491 length:522 start_codon:yes stop_codon:yes gene_type:complete
MASKIKETILGISIAIVFVFFIVFGMRAFFGEPEYQDFCDENIVRKPIKTEQECLDTGGRWNPNVPRPVKLEDESEGYCEADFTCKQEYDTVKESHNKKVFIVSGIVGLLVIILAALLHLTSVSSGLLGGGVLTILYGTLRYWSNLADYAKFIILGLTLAALIWIGYTKINKK